VAFVSVGRAASTGNATANSSTMTVTLNGQVGSGGDATDLLIFSIGSLNASTLAGINDETAVLSVTDSQGNLWEKARASLSTSATVGGGVICDVWFTNVEKPLSTVDTAVVTFSSPAARDHNVGIMWRFTKSGASVRPANSTYLQSASSLVGSMDLTQDGTEFLRFRGISCRTTLQTFTTTAGWTTIGTTRSSATAGLVMCGEFNITTATTIASNPSKAGTVSKTASVLVSFEETALMGDSIF
jgi:hypothetical protein